MEHRNEARLQSQPATLNEPGHPDNLARRLARVQEQQLAEATRALSDPRMQAWLESLDPGRRYEVERIMRGEHVPLPDDPEPTTCPGWCDEEDHLPTRQGTDHVGASGKVVSNWSTADNPKVAQTFAYIDPASGRGLVYAGDQELTPDQADEYAALVARAAALGRRIEAGA